MKKIAVLLLLISCASFAQTKVDQYEYVIVPTKFEFLKQTDQYRLNTLTKLLLQKYGFKALLSSETQPDEIVDRNCNKLYADVESYGNFIATRVRVVLKDCKNNVLFTSDEGKSKEKDWAKSYNIALRAAFESFSKLNYHYVPTANTEVVSNNRVAENAPVKVVTTEVSNSSEALFAQPISNGYQLVDSSPKIVMKIFKTTSPDRYIAVKGETHGELIAKGGKWFFEYYQNDQLVSESVNVKF